MAPKRIPDEENAESDDEMLSILSDPSDSSDGPRKGCSQWQAQVCLVLINLLTLLLGVGLVYFGIVGKQAARSASGITTLVLPGASPPDHVGVQVVHRMGRQMGEFASEYPAYPPPPDSNATAPSASGEEEEQYVARETWLSLWVLGDPYNCLIGFGTGLVILSVVGLYSACSNDRQGLFLYYTALMLLCGLLAYLGVYCLLFSDNARRFQLLYYQHRAPADMPNSQQAKEERAMAQVVRALAWAGSLCLLTSVLLAGGLFASSAQMGHGYAAKRMSMAMNLVTVVLGGGLLYLAILTTQTNAGGEWAAVIVAAAGASTVVLSLVGYFGLSRHKRWLLLIHAAALCLITALMLAAGIACLVYKDRLQSQLNANWHLIQAKVTNMDEQKVLAAVSGHLAMIGVFCLLLIACLLFNLCTSVHTLRTHWRHWNRVGGGGGGAAPRYRKTLITSEGEESDEEDDRHLKGPPKVHARTRDGQRKGQGKGHAFELAERVKANIPAVSHTPSPAAKSKLKGTSKKNKIPPRENN